MIQIFNFIKFYRTSFFPNSIQPSGTRCREAKRSFMQLVELSMESKVAMISWPTKRNTTNSIEGKWNIPKQWNQIIFPWPRKPRKKRSLFLVHVSYQGIMLRKGSWGLKWGTNSFRLRASFSKWHLIAPRISPPNPTRSLRFRTELRHLWQSIHSK